MKLGFQFLNCKNCMYLILFFGACISMSACQSLGTPVIQLDIEMDVQVSDSFLRDFQITYVASAPLFPYALPHYVDKDMEWTVRTYVDVISMDVRNVSEHALDVVWNQARWRSSFQEQWSDFLVHGQFVGRSDNQSLAISTDIESQFNPEPWTLKPGEEEYFFFRAAIGKGPENPEGLLFGVSKQQVVVGSFQNAIDRWVEIEFPVVSSESRVVYTVRLVLKDAAAWTSYY